MSTRLADRIKKDPLMTARLSAAWNLIYGALNAVICARQGSYWYLTLAAYFCALGALRILAMSLGARRPRAAYTAVGAGLLFLAVTVCGTVVLTIREARNPALPIAAAVAYAAAAFALLGFSVRGMFRAGHGSDARMITTRVLSCAAAGGSMLSLERVMLGTFGVRGSLFNVQMEAASGAVLFVFLVAAAARMMIRAARA